MYKFVKYFLDCHFWLIQTDLSLLYNSPCHIIRYDINGPLSLLRWSLKVFLLMDLDEIFVGVS